MSNMLLGQRVGFQVLDHAYSLKVEFVWVLALDMTVLLPVSLTDSKLTSDRLWLGYLACKKFQYA